MPVNAIYTRDARVYARVRPCARLRLHVKHLSSVTVPYPISAIHTVYIYYSIYIYKVAERMILASEIWKMADTGFLTQGSCVSRVSALWWFAHIGKDYTRKLMKVCR